MRIAALLIVAQGLALAWTIRRLRAETATLDALIDSLDGYPSTDDIDAALAQLEAAEAPDTFPAAWAKPSPPPRRVGGIGPSLWRLL